MTSGEVNCHWATNGLSAAGRSGAEGARLSAAWLSDPEVSSQKLPRFARSGQQGRMLVGGW